MPKTHTATSAAVGTASPATGTATSRPAAIPVTVPTTRRKPRTSVSPRDAVLTKIHQAVPTAQYQRSSETSCPAARATAQAAVAWNAWRVVGRSSPRPGSGDGTAGGGVRRSTHQRPKRTAEEASRARPTAANSPGSCAVTACRNWVTKNIMNAKIPSACPRGPQRLAYTPQKTTASQAAARAGGWSCSRVASASTGNPATGSSAVVTAWRRTVASPTVKSARRAASPPVMEAVSDSPHSSATVTARPMPSTARRARRRRRRPGSGATNIFFTAVPLPLTVVSAAAAAARGGGRRVRTRRRHRGPVRLRRRPALRRRVSCGYGQA